MISRATLLGSRSIWDFIRNLQGNAIAFAIIGTPGSDNTTMLHHVTLLLAENLQRKYRLRSQIPIFLYVREHAKAIVTTDGLTLGILVDDVIGSRYRHIGPRGGWFESRLRAGKCTVLLDG